MHLNYLRFTLYKSTHLIRYRTAFRTNVQMENCIPRDFPPLKHHVVHWLECLLADSQVHKRDLKGSSCWWKIQVKTFSSCRHRENPRQLTYKVVHRLTSNSWLQSSHPDLRSYVMKFLRSDCHAQCRASGRCQVKPTKSSVCVPEESRRKISQWKLVGVVVVLIWLCNSFRLEREDELETKTVNVRTVSNGTVFSSNGNLP